MKKKRTKEIISTITIVVILSPAIIYVAPFLVGGFLSAIVLGGSMEPTIHVGSIVIVRAVNPEEIKVGDIIAFKTGESNIIHRVIEKIIEGDSFYFRTKGDANENPDSWIVKPEDIIGIFHIQIPYYGYLIWFARTPIGVILMLIIPAAIFIASEIKKILRHMRERRTIKE